MKKTCIMIADDAQALPAITKALSGYDLVVVTDIKDAQYRILEDSIDLFVVGVHFDDSQAIELVNKIRDDKKHNITPVLFIRLLPTTYKSILKRTVNALVKAGTISQYLELEDDTDLARKIQEAVEALLPGVKKNVYQ